MIQACLGEWRQYKCSCNNLFRECFAVWKWESARYLATDDLLSSDLSFPQRLPLGRKNVFFPIFPARFLFTLSPAFTRHKEASAEEGD